MSERDAFTAAICAAPDDDVPRLAFADYLEEHGDARRAEFVRVQCELARADEFTAPWRALRDRQDALLKKHASTWRKPFASLAQRVTFRRGFVEGVAVYPKLFAYQTEKLFTLGPVRHVEFVPVPRAGPAYLPFGHVLALTDLGRLTGLDLTELMADSRLSALESGTRDDGLLRATVCLQLGQLRTLAIPGPLSNPAVLSRLFDAAHFPDLTELHVSRSGEDAFAEWLAGKAGLRRLTRLRLEVYVGRTGVEALAASPHVAGLTHLALVEGARGSDETMYLGPFAARALADSPYLAGLISLDLAQQGLGEQGVAALAGSPHLAGLRHLNLSGDRFGKFTDATAAALAATTTLTQLGVLDLSGTKPSARAVARLRARFPDAEILTGPAR